MESNLGPLKLENRQAFEILSFSQRTFLSYMSVQLAVWGFVVGGFKETLSGGNRTSVGEADQVIRKLLKAPSGLAEIYKLFLDGDPVVAMRASYVAMRVAEQSPESVKPFAKDLLKNLEKYTQQEVRWHIPQLLVHLDLTKPQRKRAYDYYGASCTFVQERMSTCHSATSCLYMRRPFAKRNWLNLGPGTSRFGICSTLCKSSNAAPKASSPERSVRRGRPVQLCSGPIAILHFRFTSSLHHRLLRNQTASGTASFCSLPRQLLKLP